MPDSMQLLINPGRAWPLGVVGGNSKAGQILSADYTAGSLGTACAYRFIPPKSGIITKLAYFITARAGTPPNSVLEIRQHSGSTVPVVTAPGLFASQTVTPPGATTTWTQLTLSTPQAVTQSTPIWFVFATPTGASAGNSISIATNGGPTAFDNAGAILAAVTSSNGFSTGSVVVGTPPVVFQYDDGTVVGYPYTTNANYTSNTLRRGLKLTPLTMPLTVSGVNVNSGASITAIEVYNEGSPPGSPIISRSVTGSIAIQAATFEPFVLDPGMGSVRIVCTFSTNSTAPGYLLSEDYAANAAFLGPCRFGGGWCSTIDDGAGGWTDEQDRLPRLALLVDTPTPQYLPWTFR
jgi:hypothetical protein